MSHMLHKINDVKTEITNNVPLTLSNLTGSPTSTSVLGIDDSGTIKKLELGTQVGDLILSYITKSDGWGGSGTRTDGFQLRMRGNSSNIKENTSYVTRHLQGSANFLIGWTLESGNYLMILKNCIDTNSGGSCNAQIYNVNSSAHEGPKIHFSPGNFSSTLTHYVSISSATRYEFRLRDTVGTVRNFNDTAHYSCTFNIFKI